MREEGIELSQRERERLKVLHEVPQGHWRQREAVGRLQLSRRQSQDAHRLLGREHRLEEILSVREPRSVANDSAVRWAGQRWAIARAEVRAGLRRARVLVERRV